MRREIAVDPIWHRARNLGNTVALILFAIRTEDAGHEEIQIFLKIDKELPNRISAENLFQSPVLVDGDG